MKKALRFSIGLQAIVMLTGLVQSQDNLPTEPPTTAPPALATQQKAVSERFSRLEALLLRSADLEAVENPTRAALLQQAVQMSKQAALNEMLTEAATRLEQGQFSEAIDKQKISRENLKRLLDLLQSENREERIREQRDEVRRWIEETDRLLRLQSSLRGRTEGGQEAAQSAQDQERLANKATDIAEELGGEASSKPDEQSGSSEAEEKNASPNKTPAADPAENKTEGAKPNADEKPNADQKSDEPKVKSGDSSQGEEEKNSESKSSKAKESNGSSEAEKLQSQQSDSPAGDGKKNSESKESPAKRPSDSQDGGQQNGEPQPGEPTQDGKQQGQQQQGQQADSSEGQEPEPPKSPTERAKQRIEQAQQKMKEAQEQLENAEREGAVEKQREAEEQLRAAIEELEEILRQLREEEVERSLVSLETRLRRMIEMQNKVVDETTRLQEITDENSTRQVQISAGRLATDERKILAEGERAYLLLRDEGSSAAFPEAIEQLNIDIASVAERLTAGDVGSLTLNIEQEIVSSLEEMVAALAQVQKENREKQQQRRQQQQQPGQPGEQPLVDKLAELRLIRTLQVRINNRTGTLSKQLSDPTDPKGQAREQDILDQLKDLSNRQSNIQQVTRDIVVGKGE